MKKQHSYNCLPVFWTNGEPFYVGEKIPNDGMVGHIEEMGGERIIIHPLPDTSAGSGK